MIRIYCDRNIFSNIKEGKRNFDPKLREMMDSLKGKLIFTYSDAHHFDLSNSKEEFWNEDLKLMEDYVKDNYFVYDPIKKRTDLFLASPTQSFFDIDYKKNKEISANPLAVFDELAEDEDDYGLIDFAKKIFNAVLDLPLPIHQAEGDEMQKSQNEVLWKFLPNGENSKMRDVFHWGTTLLHDNKQVIAMKKMMEEFVSSEKYSFDLWKEDFNEKFKENFQGKSFTDLMETTFNNVSNYSEYDKFLLFYNSLELHNITKDKPLRQTQNLSSINTDANHAWYASFSDYLVTDDKGLQVKAFLTYKYFSIKTQILSTEEFLQRRSFFLEQEETEIVKTLKTLSFEKGNGFVLRAFKNHELLSQNIIKLSHHFFNYFNRLALSTSSDILYCQRHANANFIMFKEIEVLTNKLIFLLGVDDENMGYYDFEVEDKNKEIIRKWTFDNYLIVFGTANNNSGNCLSLTFTTNQYSE